MSVANLPNYRHVLQTFITQSDGKQLISHQIESFNQFIEVDIPEIIHMSNPVTSYGSPEIPLAGPRSALATATGLSTTAANALMGTAVDGTAAVGRTVRHEYEVTLEFEKISIRKPTIFENNGAIHPMMPNDARLRNLTYAAPLNVDVKVTTTFIDHTRNSIREANVRIFPNVHLGKIPIMVGSKYCLLHDQKHVHPSKMGECAEDVGGYFIVQGGERAMISMERMSENRPFVFRNGRVAAKQLEMVEIKCIGPDNDQVPKSNTIKIVYHPKNQLITMLRATIPRIKTDIPVAILFRALGILADMDMYELILGHIEKGSEEAYDSIMTETILEGSSICTQEQAYAWLAEHTNTWSVKSQKQTNVQDILSEELFPHIGGKEMNYEKACFLAHMCRKVLWTISKRIPTDDRDAYPNKRVDIPGFLLADLFRKTYNNRMVKDMKAALSKEIHGGSWKATGNWTEIVNINNINKIIKSTIMDVCLKSSLATGNFGCGKIGGPNKVGVSQVLNRMNYSASISHLRRISTPIEKTGKLIAPRKQHNSQAFYVCVRGNTAILQGDGMTSREIISMKDGDQVITADATTLAETPSAIHHYFKTTPRAIIEFVTLSGRTIGCSPDHPLLIMRENGESEWIHACDVQQGDSVVVKNYTVPVATDNGKEPLVITREMITAVDSSEKRIDALSRFFREVSEDEKQILARLIGASATDGTLTKVIYGYSGNFYVGEVADALAIRADIERLGFASRPYRKRNTVFNKPGERTVEYQCYDVTVGGAIATLLVALGGLVGKKGMTETPVVPSWIMNGSSAVKREFLSAFQGGDGCRIKGANRTCISMGRTQQTCSTAFATGHRAYMEQINALFAEFGVKTWVTVQNNGEKTIHFINFQHTYENFSRYVTTIGYRYCAEKCRTSALYIEYALYRASLQNTKMDTVDQIRTLRADGMTYVQIQHTIEGVMSIESIRRFCQQKDKEVNPSCRNYLTIEEFRAKTRQVDDKIIMPITTIRECEVEDVYDFTTESENHDFYANGILVRNCPCETPEGHGVGVVKNMAVSTGISIFSSPITVYAFLQRMDKLLTLREATVHQKHNDTRVFLNGSWVGVLLCEDTCEVVDRLRKAKRSGILHLHTGIVWKNAFKELWITTEAGRVLRPIYYAPTLREIATNPILAAQIHEIREWNNLLMWRSPTGKALIEYVDAGETDGLYIAMDGAKAIADPSTTHCEIHPSLILGTTASYIPFPDHNQSPRNAYQCLWEEEEVLMESGLRKAIKDVEVGECVMSVNPETGALVSSRVLNQYVRETDKPIYRLTTVSGRTLVATNNHPLMLPEGWMTVDEICKHPAPMIGIAPNWIIPDKNVPSRAVCRTLEEMQEAMDAHHLCVLESLKLAPLWNDDVRLPVIARLIGYLQRDGHNLPFIAPLDMDDLKMDMAKIGMHYEDLQGTLGMITLVALGAPHADCQILPQWIMYGSDNIKREYLAGTMGRFGASLMMKEEQPCLAPLSWTCSLDIREKLRSFVSQLSALFTWFDVETMVEHGVSGEEYHVSLVFAQDPANLLRFYEVVGYRYHTEKITESFKIVECIKTDDAIVSILMARMLVRGRMVFVPLETCIPHANVRISDITVDNHFHSFITTSSIISHNSSMGKQAMGIYALNFRERFDAMSHVLCYPEVPMVSTYMSRFYGAEKLPAGQNIVVAIMTYTGYNQEDSNMINRAALDRGRFRSIFYRTYKDEERKNQSSGEEEKFCSPDPVETKHMKNAHYDKLAEDGFVPKNTFVTPDDILIGKVVPLRVPTGAVLPAGAKKSRDVSKMPRNNEKGYVDKIYKNRNGEGYSFVKIRMRQDRIPEIGDKFCLTADHDVLTRGRGWVPIADVTMEDEVAQLNRETNTMEYVTPLETLVFDQDGDMYEVESQGVSLHVTMNHRMWVQRRDKPAYELIEASKIMGKRVRYQSAAPVNREDLEITIGEERFREERMDAWLAVLGIWLAEGWTSIRPNDSICRVEFAANKPRVLQKLNACCEALNWKYNYVNSSQKFYINHREITHYLSPLSVGAVNKRVPQWAFELSARQTRILIDGMCLGDGHETATSLHYSTSSVGLRDDLQVLCQHAGWTSYYAKRYEAGHQNTMKDGRIITNTHDNWDIGIRRTRLYPTMNHGHVNEQDGQAESVHPFTGKVYCLRVPSEVFLVRRHARIVWTGNSSRHGSNEPQCGIKPMLVRCCP